MRCTKISDKKYLKMCVPGMVCLVCTSALSDGWDARGDSCIRPHSSPAQEFATSMYTPSWSYENQQNI